MSRSVVGIGGRRLPLTNLEKDLYPSYGFTKAHILDYYRRIAPFILPHLKDRPVTLKRYPEGVEADFFFEKRCPRHRPAWLKTVDIVREGGERLTACLVNDLETLIWVENLASIELHVPLARAGSPTTPDAVVFDLDPGDGADVLACARVALIIRDLLVQWRLAGFVKTSGRKGLHLYVPLNRQEATFDDTKMFSKAVAVVLQRSYPGLVTSQMAKDFRKGRVFINWSQNDPSKTMVSVYSLRAGEKPYASFPLSWEELERAAERGDPEKLRILHSEAVRRAEKYGDAFGQVLKKKQRLPAV